MEKTIWKYELKVTAGQNILMPIGAEILTVQMQGGTPYLWGLVNPKAETESRSIEMFGTGNPVLYNTGVSRKYISTFQMQNGGLVFHVFEYTGVRRKK